MREARERYREILNGDEEGEKTKVDGRRSEEWGSVLRTRGCGAHTVRDFHARGGTARETKSERERERKRERQRENKREKKSERKRSHSVGDEGWRRMRGERKERERARSPMVPPMGGV